jgi:hypothetical protein
MTYRSRIAGLAAFLALATSSLAVSLNPEGVGQALVFPYYTANSSGGNAFNTYISIVNHTTEVKALRVRFREGRNGREALAFNLYLSPRDVWTGAIVPAGSTTRLLSTDSSCTDPPLQAQAGAASFLPFTIANFSGGNEDGAGTDPQRTREGFVEVLEMGVLGGASAAAVTNGAAGNPLNCGAMVGNATPTTTRPTGGLSGTLTLINVANGMDFTVNAEALSDLASRAYFRAPGDPYPDFNAAEIDAVSEVAAGGSVFRSRWSRPVDAVSAALLRAEWLAEYALDPGTLSLTDVVLTFPTRHFYTAPASALPPFTMPAAWSFDCGGPAQPIFGPPDTRGLLIEQHNREARFTNYAGAVFTGESVPRPRVCATAAVVNVRGGSTHMPAADRPTFVLGSETGGISGGSLVLASTFNNGWVRFIAPTDASLTSLATSTRWTAAGGTLTGAHRFTGQPVVGFAVRTFRNGTLACAGATCQGNYGGAFPLKYIRTIAPAP